MTQSAWNKLCPHSNLHIVLFFHSKFVAQPWRKFCSSSCKRNGKVSSHCYIIFHCTPTGVVQEFGFTDSAFCTLCRSRELLIPGGREGLSGTHTLSETAAPTSAQSYVDPSHQGVCVYVGGDYVTSGLLLASSLSGMNEGQAYFCPSSLLLPWLAFSSVYWTDEGSWMSLQ